MSTFYCRECNVSYMGQTHECETIEKYRSEMTIFEWECQTCGEVFDKRKTSQLQHNCPVALEARQFESLYTRFLESTAGKFAVYYARHLIDASTRSNNTLA